MTKTETSCPHCNGDTMKICVADIEADGLLHLQLDDKKQPKQIATKIHCIAIKTLGVDDQRLYTPNKLKEGLKDLNSYDYVIGHNFWGFDKPTIEKFLGSVKPTVIDTLILSLMLFPDKYNVPMKRHSMEHWGEYLGWPKTNYQGGWEKYNDEMGAYCVDDVILNEHIYRKQQEFMRGNARTPKASVLLEHEIAEIGALEIAHHGFRVEREKIPQVKQVLEAEAADILFQLKQSFPDEVTPKFHKTTGKPTKPDIVEFKPNSGQKVGYYFQKYLNYEFDIKEDTGNYITDNDALKLCPHPEAQLVLDYRDRATMISYLNDWEIRTKNSEYIHHTLRGVGTQTGRASHSEPNLGQVSKASYARTLFIAHPGEILVGADLQGLELRMLAHYLTLHGNTDYVNVVLNGDVHWHNALLAGLATDENYDPENPIHKKQRDNSKTFIYGWLYGAGVGKIGKIINGTARDGARLREQFLNNIPGLKSLKDDVTDQARKDKGVLLVDGRRVPVRSQHAALNTLLQGSGAMVCKKWLVNVYKEKKDRNMPAKILAWVHDEIQSSVDSSVVAEYKDILLMCANKVQQQYNLHVPIDAEAMSGTNWKETH